MDELQRYREAVDAYWPAVDDSFDRLPGSLCQQGRLLREDLAVRLSSTGEFHDILRRPDDHPLLQYHLWLLDDLGVPEDDRRTALEARLFSAVVLTLSQAAIQRDMQAADSFIDTSYAGLANALSRQINEEFSAVVSRNSPFWEAYREIWDAADGAVADPTTEARLAPFLLSGLAVYAATGRDTDGPRLLEALAHLNAVLAIRHDLLAVRRDLTRGTITEPVRLMMEAAGLDESAVSDPARLLGALLIAGAIETVEPIWRPHLDALAGDALGLGLPTIERYAGHLGAVMNQLGDALRLGPPAGRTTTSPPHFEPASDALAEATIMAERYLLADPTMREAWEVHRWGMAGAPEVTARFPSGIVIETLGRHGQDVAVLVDDFYRQAAKKRFAYYDHPGMPYVETDTLGAMLRLYPYSRQTEWHRGCVDEFLELLTPHIGKNGRLPVWLVDHADDLLLGEGCGTIEAGLISGLLDYGASRLTLMAKAAADRLLEDFRRRRAAITVNYPRTYALTAVAGLLSRLEGREAEWIALADQIGVEAARNRLTPMTAACLIRATAHPETGHLTDDSWATTIVKGQSFDGGWTAEPMFFAPNRGRNVTWYSSRLVTSALCYDALRTAAS